MMKLFDFTLPYNANTCGIVDHAFHRLRGLLSSVARFKPAPSMRDRRFWAATIANDSLNQTVEIFSKC